MKKFLPCKRICPVVAELEMRLAELKHEIANKDTEISRLEMQTRRVSKRNRELEVRLAKVRQASFGVLDIKNTKGMI